MGSSAARMLVIGLDLGSGDVVREWCDAGRLPALRSLRERGTWRWLETTARELHVSAWPSLYTGTPPGEHGVYYTFQPAPGLQGWRRFERGQYGVPTFWRLLGDAGVSCAVFDAPYTHPEEGTRATQIFDWGTWAQYWRTSSIPGRLVRELRRARGPYPLGLEAHDLGLAFVAAEEIQPRLVGSVTAKTDAALWLLDRQEWDLFFVVYGEPHPGAHYCWSPEGDLRLLRELYEEIDRGIGRLVERAGDSADVVVVSGDGVAANRAAWHMLPEVLRRSGFLVEPGHDALEPADGAGDPPQGSKRRDPVKVLRDLLPIELRKSLARRLPAGVRAYLGRRVDTASIEWSRTRAYCLPTDLEGCVRVNLRGREPHGIVSPGEEYARTCDELEAVLRELVDPSTDRPAVREVVRVDERFPGRRRAYLPDLVALWDDAGELRTLTSSRIGSVSEPSPDARPGTHAAPGWTIERLGTGGGSREGHGHVCELAPTILSRFGVQPPDHMTGRSWTQGEQGGIGGRSA